MKYYILNGWAAPPTVWQRFIHGLAPNTAEVLQPTAPAEPDVIIAEAIRRLSAESSRYALIGWSMGALMLQAILPALPRQPECLILTGAASRLTQGPENPDGWPPAALQRMADSLKTDPAATLQAFSDKLLSRRERAQGFEDELHQFSWEFSDPAALAAGLQFLAVQDCSAFFAQLSVPVLLLHGAADRICPLSAAERTARLLPRSELISFSHTGHMPFFTHTKECQDALLHFSERIRYENR